MAVLMLTAASPVGYLDHPSICVHHEENLVVGAFSRTRTMFNDLVYRVGRLDKGGFNIQWGIDVYYSKGCDPSIALIRTAIGEEQRYYVVETHKSQFYKTCYYRVGEVNEDLFTIDFGPDIWLCRGLKPKVCAKDDRTVIIITEKTYSPNSIQYRIGRVNVDAKTINWHVIWMEFIELPGISPSISISEENHVVVACVYRSNLVFIVGDLQDRHGRLNIVWGAAGIHGKGTNPSISVNSHGHVVEAHQKEFLRMLCHKIGVCDERRSRIAWDNNNCIQYTLGRFPSISIADDGYVIESHKTNFGNQTFLSHGQLRHGEGPEGPVDVPPHVPDEVVGGQPQLQQ